MNSKAQDLRLIADIRKGGPAADRALCRLYDLSRDMVTALVLKNSGQRDDALDVLQDSVVITYERIRSGDYEYQSKLTSYVYAVARFVWLKQLRRKQTEARILETAPEADFDPGPLPDMLSEEYTAQVREVFSRLGEDCRRLLTFLIYDHLSPREVVEKMHYQNEQVVRNKKYKCLKHLKQMLEMEPALVAILKNYG